MPLQIKELKLKIDLQIREGTEITLFWIPRDSMVGNKRADAAAKNAADLTNINGFRPHSSSLLTKVRGAYMKDWHQCMEQYLINDTKKNYISRTAFVFKKENKILNKLPRKDCVVMRFLSGYVRDKEYLFTINRVNERSCKCGADDANLDHDLWRCPQHIINRYTLSDSLFPLIYVPFPRKYSSTLHIKKLGGIHSDGSSFKKGMKSSRFYLLAKVKGPYVGRV